MFGKFGVATLSVALALGLATAAEAAPKRKHQRVHPAYAASVNGYPAGMFLVSLGDPLPRTRNVYPYDPNPPSLGQRYHLCFRLLQEERN